MLNQDQGEAAEEWFKEFARNCHLLSSQTFTLESVVRLFNEKLQLRLQSARLYIDDYFSYANEWIDQILSRKRLPPQCSDQEKTNLADKLLDLVLATDALVELKDHQGQDHLICVDVTSNPNKESGKLNKIRGHRQGDDPRKLNRNLNLPLVRQQLGMTKHLIVILNPDNPPSYQKLLAELHAFVNAPAKTGSINLWVATPELSASPEQAATPPPTPQQLWNQYSQGRQQTDLPHLIRSAKIDGHSPEQIARILEYHPSYQSLAQKARPEAAQRYNAALVERELEQQQQQALWAAGVIRVVLSRPSPKVQRQPDGSVALQGKSFEYRQQAETVSLIAQDGRGEILRVNGGQVEVDKLTGQDLEKCRQVQEQILAYQQAAQQKDTQQRGNGPVR